MWGNSLGWGISALIVALTVGSLVWLSRSLDTISDPTDFSTKSGAADAIATPPAPPQALPDGSPGVDSVSLYHQAIDLYHEKQSVFDRFSERHSRADLEAIEPAVDLIVKAAGKDSLGIFAATPKEAISYESNTPLSTLRILGGCTSGAGLLHKLSHDNDVALADLRAAFCLGQRMADERLCYAEFSDGLGLMGGSSAELGEMAKDGGDQPQADTLNHFAAALSNFSNEKVVPIQTVLSSIDQPVIDKNAGDIFWLAKNSKERMWRVESIMKLGRLKYNAPRPGDNRAAARIVTEMATTASDPVIKTAATEARDLSLDQYNMLH